MKKIYRIFGIQRKFSIANTHTKINLSPPPKKNRCSIINIYIRKTYIFKNNNIMFWWDVVIIHLFFFSSNFPHLSSIILVDARMNTNTNTNTMFAIIVWKLSFGCVRLGLDSKYLYWNRYFFLEEFAPLEARQNYLRLRDMSSSLAPECNDVKQWVSILSVHCSNLMQL